MENKKSYYAIIPASVRYDSNLSQGSKLLYGEISALCNEQGFCWAGNDYFADLYDKSDRTISRWIRDLEKEGFVLLNYRYKEGTKFIESRCITLCETLDKNVLTVRQKCLDSTTKMSEQLDENGGDNNTYINNTFNNTKDIYTEPKTSSKKEEKDIDPEKSKYGEFSHVELTQEQYRELGKIVIHVNDLITILDEYLENNRQKKYANHFLMLKSKIQWPMKTYLKMHSEEVEINAESKGYFSNVAKGYKKL